MCLIMINNFHALFKLFGSFSSRSARKMSDVLAEIPNERLLSLRDAFKTNWPEHALPYYFLNNCIKWGTKYSEKLITVLAPEGKREEGTFVAIIRMSCYEIYIYTLEKSCEQLELALAETKLIEWDNPLITFADVCYKHENALNCARNSVGRPADYDAPSQILMLQKETALNLKIKEVADAKLVNLQAKDAKIINHYWPHSFEGSEGYIATMIERNGGLGLVSTKDDRLCAWMIRNYYGGLAILHTLEDHRRKGYAKYLTMSLAKKIAQEEQIDLIESMVVGNSVSYSLSQSIGFKKLWNCNWYMGSKINKF